MAKLWLISLVLVLAGILWTPHSVEAKPFFFKFFDFPQSVPTARVETPTPTVSTFVLTDFLARKLQFIAGLLSNSGSVSYSVGFNKFGQTAATTQKTTTSKPISTTPLQTVFAPDSTESLAKAPVVVTESTPIEGSQSAIASVQTEVVLGAGKVTTSTSAAPATAAPTEAPTTTARTTAASTTAETSAKPAPFSPTFAPIFAPTFAPTLASETTSTTTADTAIGADVNSALSEQFSNDLTFTSSVASLFTAASIVTPPSTSAGTSSGQLMNSALIKQPSNGLTFASSDDTSTGTSSGDRVNSALTKQPSNGLTFASSDDTSTGTPSGDRVNSAIIEQPSNGVEFRSSAETSSGQLMNSVLLEKPANGLTFASSDATLAGTASVDRVNSAFIEQPSNGVTFASSAGTTSGDRVNSALIEQPSNGLIFASSDATPTTTAAPTSAPSIFVRPAPSLAPTPASSTDKIIILSLFDQTSGSTSAPGNPSATVGPLLPVDVATKSPANADSALAQSTTLKKPGYGYSDPNVLLFDASNEIFNDVQKPAADLEVDRLDLDIRT